MVLLVGESNRVSVSVSESNTNVFQFNIKQSGNFRGKISTAWLRIKICTSNRGRDGALVLGLEGAATSGKSKVCLLTLSRAYRGLRIPLSTAKPEVTKPD